jgi:UDP-N-acetylglucosamine 1-carboxyvinyltransferase
MTPNAYIIRGGSPVVGTIRCLGAKNFVTKAMVASILAETPSRLVNVPAIGDTIITSEMLSSVGVGIRYDAPGEMVIDPSSLSNSHVPIPQSGSNRIPILLLAALLQRFGEVSVPVLGGCKIGARGVDFHLGAIKKFGGEVEQTDRAIVATRSRRLRGAHIHLPYPSVGATESCLFLGALAEGRTVISNAAIEPEINELITMLRAMGAMIYTSAGREIRIDGVNRLNGTRMEILGDRIEAASLAALACASDGEITVTGIRPENFGNFLPYFQQVGGGLELVDSDAIRFFRKSDLKPTFLETDVYPGFSTDWQQPFAILLTQADGISVVHETVYENRFGYLSALNQLGAKTQVTHQCLGSGVTCRYRDRNYDHCAIILGATKLHAAESITIPDLRAGLAYVIAAAIADGSTKVRNIHFLERGYGDIVSRLAAMGLDIQRVDDPEAETEEAEMMMAK